MKEEWEQPKQEWDGDSVQNQQMATKVASLLRFSYAISDPPDPPPYIDVEWLGQRVRYSRG